MNIKKMILGIGTFAIATAPMAASIACGSSDATKEGGIGATVYNGADPFTTLMTNAMAAEAKEQGVAFKLSDSQNDQARQNDQVDSLIDSDSKGLAINLVNPEAATTIINKVKVAKLPIVLYNKETSTSAMASYDKLYYVGTRSAEAGEMQAQLIYNDLVAGNVKDRNADGKIGYYVLSGEAGHADAIARTNAVREKLFELIRQSGINSSSFASTTAVNITGMPSYAKEDDKHNLFVEQGKSIEEIKMLFTDLTPADGTWTDWSEAAGKDNGSPIITAQGTKLDLFIANNDGLASGVATAAKEDSILEAYTSNYGTSASVNHLPIYGVDATAVALENIKNGWMAGTVVNDAKNQGIVIIRLLNNLIKGKSNKLEGLDGYTLTTDGTKAIRVPYVLVSRTDKLVTDS